jgi:hypothetical protein
MSAHVNPKAPNGQTIWREHTQKSLAVAELERLSDRKVKAQSAAATAEAKTNDESKDTKSSTKTKSGLNLFKRGEGTVELKPKVKPMTLPQRVVAPAADTKAKPLLRTRPSPITTPRPQVAAAAAARPVQRTTPVQPHTRAHFFTPPTSPRAPPGLKPAVAAERIVQVRAPPCGKENKPAPASTKPPRHVPVASALNATRARSVPAIPLPPFLFLTLFCAEQDLVRSRGERQGDSTPQSGTQREEHGCAGISEATAAPRPSGAGEDGDLAASTVSLPCRSSLLFLRALRPLFRNSDDESSSESSNEESPLSTPRSASPATQVEAKDPIVAVPEPAQELATPIGAKVPTPEAVIPHLVMEMMREMMEMMREIMGDLAEVRERMRDLAEVREWMRDLAEVREGMCKIQTDVAGVVDKLAQVGAQLDALVAGILEGVRDDAHGEQLLAVVAPFHEAWCLARAKARE